MVTRPRQESIRYRGSPRRLTGSGWTVQRYHTRAGAAPIGAFLAGLTGDERPRAAALLALLVEHGTALRPPHSTLDGIVKKQDEIPREVIKRLRGYLRDLEASEGA